MLNERPAPQVMTTRNIQAALLAQSELLPDTADYGDYLDDAVMTAEEFEQVLEAGIKEDEMRERRARVALSRGWVLCPHCDGGDDRLCPMFPSALSHFN